MRSGSGGKGQQPLYIYKLSTKLYNPANRLFLASISFLGLGFQMGLFNFYEGFSFVLLFLIFVCRNQKPLFCFKRNERRFVCLYAEENTEVEQNQRPRYRFSRHFFGLAVWLLLVHIYLYFLCFFSFGWIWNFFFFLRFENELQREQMMYKNRFLFLHFEPIGELISVWIAVDTDVLFGKSTFRLTWIYLFILFFCLNMFIKIQNFLFFGFVFLVLCVVISALWNLYLKRFLIGLWMNQVVFDLFWTSYWLHT